ncbi:MAG: hypothetical protein V3S53_03835 [Gammaproteobacteria bacterium]
MDELRMLDDICIDHVLGLLETEISMRPQKFYGVDLPVRVHGFEDITRKFRSAFHIAPHIYA